jgi:predicted nucleic acid-binding protein
MGDEKRNKAKELMKELDSIDEEIFENESVLKEVYIFIINKKNKVN